MLRAAVVLMLLVGAAQAQTAPVMMTGDDCHTSWGAIAGLTGPDRPRQTIGDGPFVASDGACEMRDIGLATGGARRLRWRKCWKMAQTMPRCRKLLLK